MGVQPNPDFATALQNLNIPPNFRGWTDFRDYMAQCNRDGVPDEAMAEMQHIGAMIQHLAMAQVDTIQYVIALDEALTQVSQQLGGQQ